MDRIGATPAQPPLVMQLFGPFEVRLDGAPLARLRSRKGQQLLALLTLRHGAEVERAWLASLLWPDSEESQAFGSLRRSLTDLRQALGEEAWRVASSSPRTLHLDLAGAYADVLAFDAAVAAGDTAALEQAVSLYRGPLLEGCAEEWVFQERQLREEGYLTALETLASHAAHHGATAAAERYLRRAVTLDPLRETAQRALIQALGASGNYAAALLAYRELRLLLHRELNAEPAPETAALIHQIRAEARERGSGGGGRERGSEGTSSEGLPSSSTRPLSLSHSLAPSLSPDRSPDRSLTPSHLPRPLTELVGRAKEIASVRHCLTTARLVTLTGSGGIGKTRLAIQVAEEVAEEYREGAWFVDLGSLQDPALLEQAVAAKLRIPEGGDRESDRDAGSRAAAFGVAQPPRSAALVDFLCPRQLLLVLDTCEHLIEPCARLAETLLQECPSLRILATSRQALDIMGETVWRVPSLSLPDDREWTALRRQWSATDAAAVSPLQRQPDVAAALAQYEAVRLFAARAASASPGFTLTPDDAEAVIQVCRQLDGIPLAIELAAARLKVLSVEQIAERLDDRFRLLTAGGRTALPRQQTLRATMDWSHDLLSDAERVLLRRLSVFAGGFTLEAAEAIGACGASVKYEVLSVKGDVSDPGALTLNTQHLTLPLAEGDVLDLLSQLVDKSLVLVAAQGAVARYRLLDTTRQYGQEALARSGEAEAARRRHAAYFLTAAETARPRLEGPEQASWLDRLEAAHDNLRAALEWWLGAPEEEESLRMAVTLQPFWRIRGHYSEGRRWLNRALALGAKPTAVRAAALVGAGNLAYLQHDLAAARSLTAEGAAIHAAREDRHGIAEALQQLGRIAFLEHDLPTACALLGQSLAIRREIGDQTGVAVSLSTLGDIASEQGDFARARLLYEQGLAIRETLGDRLKIALSLTNLGHIASIQADYEAARSFYQQSLAINRALGYTEGVAWSLDNLACIALADDDCAQAQAFFVQSLVLFRELESDPGIVDCLRGLGKTATALALAAPRGSDAGDTHLERAARLFGAVEALCRISDDVLPAPFREAVNQSIAATRDALGEGAFAAAWAGGYAVRVDRAMAYALEEIAEL